MEPISREKLLMVITKSNWGGAQSYVYELAKTYANQGHEVMVALGGTGAKGADTGQLAERLRAEQISVHFLRNFSRDVSFFQDFAAFFELVRLTAKIKPDVLHLNSSKAGGVGALAGRLSGVPTIIFTAHGWAHREFRRNFLSRFLIRLSSWATILLSHRVIVVSQLDYTDAPVLCSRKKLELIRNGIDKFELLSREEARQKLSATVPIPSDCTWMLMLAELH